MYKVKQYIFRQNVYCQVAFSGKSQINSNINKHKVQVRQSVGEIKYKWGKLYV